MGEQEAEESLFYFTVWESEGIVLELGVVVLDGEVAALVDDRYRVGGSRVDGIQHRAAGDDVLYLFHVVVVQFHEFHQVGRRTRLKPVASYLSFSEGIEQAEGIVHSG